MTTKEIKGMCLRELNKQIEIHTQMIASCVDPEMKKALKGELSQIKKEFDFHVMAEKHNVEKCLDYFERLHP